ncbi:MAG: DUF177 domain-containing protein [Flavobacteriales bacterium]|nr:DUF177 domain-containing protein [Flavobacteriales bacterium]
MNFRGLSIGKHSYRFPLDDDFFLSKGYEGVLGGDVSVDLILNKQEQLLDLHFSVSGILRVHCDVCLEEMEYPISGEHTLVLKFSSNPRVDEDIIYLGFNEYQIDLESHLYDFCMIHLPMRKVCADSNVRSSCDRDTLKKLAELQGVGATNHPISTINDLINDPQ